MSEAREEVWDEAEVVHSARMVVLWAMQELCGRRLLVLNFLNNYSRLEIVGQGR